MNLLTTLTALQSLANIVSSLSWLILLLIVYFGIQSIIREIKKAGEKVGENMPKWIDKWDDVKNKNRRIDDALAVRVQMPPLTEEEKKRYLIQK